MKWGAGSLIFLLPFFVMPFLPGQEEAISGAKLIYAFFLGNLFFAFFLGQKIHPALFFVHSYFSFCVCLTGFGSMHLYPFVYWTAAIGSSLLYLELTEENKIFFIKCVMYSGVASAIWSFMQIMDKEPIFSYASTIEAHDRVLPIAWLGQTTKFGAFLAVCIAISLSLRKWPEAAVMLLSAFFTNSSFTYGAIFVGACVALRRKLGQKKLKLIILSVSLLLLAGYIAKPDANLYWSQGRTRVWWTAIKAVWDSGVTLFGFGPGSFRVFYPVNFQPRDTLNFGDFINAHNDYVQVFFEFGAFGTLIMLGALLCLLRKYISGWWKTEGLLPPRPKSLLCAQASLAALLANALGNFPFQLSPHYMIGVISICAILNYNENYTQGGV